jgi:hypothetical protein
MELNDLVGKTVTAVQYIDEFDEGITLTFSDGTTLCVVELQQAGMFGVYVNDEFVKSEWRSDEDEL